MDRIQLFYQICYIDINIYIKENSCFPYCIYGYREESRVEKNVVSTYCNNSGIKLYIFEFKYIKRSQVDREFYEKLTRQVGFNLYRQSDANTVLGHIKEDTVENIWTNFAKGRDLFNLSKMSLFQEIEKVQINRPFLEIEKHFIIEYAHNNSIPYLKNTTLVGVIEER